MNHLTISTILGTLLMTAVPASYAADTQEVNVYTTRQPQLINPILENFTEETGIKVNVLFAEKGLVERMKLEGNQSPADLFLTADIGQVVAAVQAGVTQELNNETLNTVIPASLRDPKGEWFGLTTRARILYASKDRVAPSSITTYQELADPKWKGKICTRSGTHPYNISLVSAYLKHNGADKTKEWLKGLKANLAQKPQGNDRAQVKAIWAGKCDIAIGNTYYMGKMLENDEQKEWANSVNLVFPKFENSIGTHINISGASLAAYAPHRENAIKLLEYFVSDNAQQNYAELNFEYPVKAGVQPSELVQSWGVFKPDNLSLTDIANNSAAALKLVEEVGFDQ